jgi:MFS family permease
MLSVLRVPPVRRFFVAHLQSQLGTGAAYVALLLVAYHRLHSGWAIAVVLLADFIPGIVLSPVCGALADRMSRRRIAVAADLLRAAAFVALALTSSFVATVGLALVAGVGTALFNPALESALPSLVAPSERSRATALYGAVNNLGITIGPALTALLMLFSGPSLVLGINGVTFVISAALLARVPLGAADRSEDRAPGSLWADTRAGARAAAAIPGMSVLLVLSGAAVLAAGLMNVAEPLLATGPLHAGGSGYSLLVAAYGVGMVAASVLNSRLSSLVVKLRRRWLFGIAVNGAAMLATALAPTLAVALITFAVTGMSNMLIVGPELRLVQELAGDRLLGRVFGLRDLAGNIAFVVAFVGAGALLSLVGARALFAVGGVALLVLAPVGALLFHPSPTPGDGGPTEVDLAGVEGAAVPIRGTDEQPAVVVDPVGRARAV